MLNNKLILDLDTSISNLDDSTSDCIPLFSSERIKRKTISTLRNIKAEGISIIAITRRGIDDIRKIDKNIISIFDKIYYLNGLFCYNVEKECICDVYNKSFTVNCLTSLELNRKQIKEIIRKANIPTERARYTTTEKVVLSIDLNGLEEDSLQYLLDEISLTDYTFTIDEKHNMLEVWLFNYNRSSVAQYEKNKDEDINIVVLGGSSDDLPLIRYCELCILPKAIIDNIFSKLSFMYIGTYVSKVKPIDSITREGIVSNGLSMVLSTFQKYNKSVSNL